MARLLFIFASAAPLSACAQSMQGAFCALSPCGEWVLALGLTPLQAVELIAQDVTTTTRAGAPRGAC